MAAILWIVLGVVIGAVAYRAVVVKAPGRPVQPYEQAVIKRAGQPVVINGPAWLSIWDTNFVVGIFDVTDKRLNVLVEPVYAMLPPNPDPTAPTRQRFFVEIVIVYRPVDMVKVLSLGEHIDDWLASHVRAALRSHALTQRFELQDDGEHYARAAKERLKALQDARGIELVEVYCERLGIRTPGELASRAKGSSARNLGREGLVLTYLETLKEMANSPSTKILLPAEMSGNPDAVRWAERQ